jgi:hypothetical protein
LQAARELKRLAIGKCEGRKSHGADRQGTARKRGNSLRDIAADLAARAYLNANGKEFSAASVRSLLA